MDLKSSFDDILKCFPKYTQEYKTPREFIEHIVASDDLDTFVKVSSTSLIKNQYYDTDWRSTLWIREDCIKNKSQKIYAYLLRKKLLTHDLPLFLNDIDDLKDDIEELKKKEFNKVIIEMAEQLLIVLKEGEKMKEIVGKFMNEPIVKEKDLEYFGFLLNKKI